MARRTKAESDATAASLIDVARHLFTERGYAGVGLEEVAAEAEVTRGAIYHHFGSKVGLFEAVAAQVQAEVGDAVAAAADGATEQGRAAWDALEAGCHEFLARSLSPDARRVMLIDAPAVLGWDTWRAHDAEASGSHLYVVLAQLQLAGVIEVPSVPAAYALLSGAMNEAALWAAAEDSPDALDQAWATLRILLAALRPPVSPGGRSGGSSG